MTVKNPLSSLPVTCKLTVVVSHTIQGSVIFVNENENENGEKRENNEFVNEN